MDSLLYIATSAYYYSTLIMAPYVLLKYKVIGLKKKNSVKKKKKLVQNDNGISFSVYVNLKNVIRSNTQESRVVLHVVNGLIERHVLYL